MEIEKFIGEKAEYDDDGQYIWGVDKEGNHQKLADLRGWGAIQNLFKKYGGEIDLEKAEQFQKELGEWIADAINNKLHHKTGYDLRIGNSYDYYETDESNPMPCKLINILHDGHYVVYEFKHDNSTGIGATIYPQRLKQKK